MHKTVENRDGHETGAWRGGVDRLDQASVDLVADTEADEALLERLVEAWGDTVFHTVIRRTVKFSDSTVAGEPITSYASSSPAAEAYRQLAKEVALRCPDV